MNEFASRGYQVVRNVLSSDETSSMRDAITETMDRVARALRAPIELSFPEVPLEHRIDTIAAKDRVHSVALFRAALADTQRDPRMDSLSAHPGLNAVIADLLKPLMRTGQTIRARAAVGSLSTARSPWHQDVVRETNHGFGTVKFACWMPLRDINEHSGAIEVIPGFWRAPLPHVEDAEGGRFYIPAESIPEKERHTVFMRRGDVLILDRFIPHRSLPAAKGDSRWAVVMWVKAV